MAEGKGPGTATVLVVEDEEAARRYVVTVLRAEGYVVLDAADAAAAGKAATRFGVPVDLLVADYVLPDGDGAAVAAALRPLFPRMKVLFVSGHIQEEVVQKGVSEEAFKKGAAFLQKPFSAEDLVRKVRAILRGS